MTWRQAHWIWEQACWTWREARWIDVVASGRAGTERAAAADKARDLGGCCGQRRTEAGDGAILKARHRTGERQAGDRFAVLVEDRGGDAAHAVRAVERLYRTRVGPAGRPWASAPEAPGRHHREVSGRSEEGFLLGADARGKTRRQANTSRGARSRSSRKTNSEKLTPQGAGPILSTRIGRRTGLPPRRLP